tara:strand:- start:1666 stop:1929 length:264 start_codon:yes stop_codon:yes gene_type:complete
MVTELTQTMKDNIKNAVFDGEFLFKYSNCLNVETFVKTHRVMIKGEKTEQEWVWIGGQGGVYEFDSYEQAILFIKEMKAEIQSRIEE